MRRDAEVGGGGCFGKGVSRYAPSTPPSTVDFVFSSHSRHLYLLVIHFVVHYRRKEAMSYPTFQLNNVNIPTGLYIGGKWVKGRGPPLETLNPATEKVHGTVDTASAEDVDDAVIAAREAFETTWGLEVSANERGELMFRLAELLDKAKDELAELEAIDCGKPVSCEYTHLV